MESMERLLVTLTALSAVALAGCSGGGNPCVLSCERMKDCAEASLAKINCDDPMYKQVCDAVKKALAIDCSQAGGAACSGEYRAESERTMSCSLDPNTCICPRNICLESCKEQKDCAEDSLRDLDCTDAANKALCDALEPMEQKDCYAVSDAACTGAAKTAAEAIDACWPLDRSTCVCKTP
jgi:hypothetical protein